MGIQFEPSDIDLLSFVFENEGGNQDKPVCSPLDQQTYPSLTALQVLIDAGDASRFVTPRTARKVTRQLIAGLKAEGLQPGDCVCIHSFNDVWTEMALDIVSPRHCGCTETFRSITLCYTWP